MSGVVKELGIYFFFVHGKNEEIWVQRPTAQCILVTIGSRDESITNATFMLSICDVIC